MAMNKTSTFQQDVLAWVTGTAMPTAPTGIYLALFTADPGEAGSTTNELATADGYARHALTLGSASLSTNKHQRTNSATLVFGPFTASVAPTHCAICKSGTRGTADLLYYGPITDVALAPITATTGQVITIAAGSLVVAEG